LADNFSRVQFGLVWFGFLVHPFSHICSSVHLNYRLQFTTQLRIYGQPHNNGEMCILVSDDLYKKELKYLKALCSKKEFEMSAAELVDFTLY
jgi:hypothetical protein